jgi:hypothetical protein
VIICTDILIYILDDFIISLILRSRFTYRFILRISAYDVSLPPLTSAWPQKYRRSAFYFIRLGEYDCRHAIDLGSRGVAIMLHISRFAL